MRITNNTLSIIFILIGMSIFSIQDLLIRVIASEISLFQIHFTRSAVGTILLCLYLKFYKIPIVFKTSYPVLTTIRTTLFLFGFTLFYVALANLSFAITTALFFTSPFFITVLSRIFLKEKIGLYRWATVGFGFIGVIIIINPSVDNINYYMLMPIICALCYSSSMIIIKLTSDKDSVYSQTFHFYLTAIILCPIVALVGEIFNLNTINNRALEFMFRPWNFSLNISLLFSLLIGVTAAVAFVLTISAYRLGKPFIVAPFEYILLVWAIIYGWLFWDEVVSLRSWIGIIMIVTGGIYIFYREKINDQNLSIDKPLR